MEEEEEEEKEDKSFREKDLAYQSKHFDSNATDSQRSCTYLKLSVYSCSMRYERCVH